MRLTITDRLVAKTAQEGQAVPFAIACYTDVSEPWLLVAPTTLRYRVDDPVSGRVIADWTTVTPASTATITVSGSNNTLSGCNSLRRQLVVEADHGLDTCAIERRDYWIRSLVGVVAA